MIRWQYRTIRFAAHDEFTVNGEIFLNQLGQEGWEVCASVPWGHGLMFTLKRPIAPPPTIAARVPQ